MPQLEASHRPYRNPGVGGPLAFGARLATAVGAALQRVFRERDLVLRSAGRVIFLRLRPRTQVLTVALLAAVLVWSAWASIAVWRHDQLLTLKQREITESRVAYDFILRQVEQYSQEIAALLAASDASVSASAGLHAVLERGRHLESALEMLTADLTASTQDRTRLIASRTTLHGRLSDLDRRNEGLETALSVAQRRIVRDADVLAQVNAEKAALAADLAMAKDDAIATRQENEIAARLLASLNQRFGATTAMTSALTASTLEGKTAEASDTNKPNDFSLITQARLLDHSGAVVLQALQRSRQEAAQSGDALSEVLKGLQRVAVKGAANYEGLSPPQQAKRLIGDLVALHETQLEILGRLSEETNAKVVAAEAVVAATGLSPERMIAKQRPALGQGGPFESADEAGLAETRAADLAVRVATLDHETKRWSALRSVLQCIPFSTPLADYRPTSGFGVRRDPFNGRRAFHGGLDLDGQIGTPVYAAAGGVVVEADRNGEFGRMVAIDHGCGVRTIYAHLSKILVKKGQRVATRTLIGKVGNSGRSTGAHLHYEVRVNGKPRDPVPFIEEGRHVRQS